jgi:1,4-dihydroxy-2-naphthoate octaprenyltransferase
LAARPKTLAAGAVPVVGGAASAWRDSDRPWLVVPCLLCALCIQIGTNLFNDYYDAKKGADAEDRVGPVRVTASGLISPGGVLAAACAVFALAAAFGVVVVAVAGWPLLVVGAVSLLCGWLYTAGPYPLAYLGLGEVFVFVFFGLIATAGTAYALTGALSTSALLAGAAVGALSTCLIVVNNVRDVHGDARAHKRTVAVRFGVTFARTVYVLCLAVAAAAVLALAARAGISLGASSAPDATRAAAFALPFAVLALGVRNARAVWRNDGAALNAVLGASARVLALFGVALSIALAWP